MMALSTNQVVALPPGRQNSPSPWQLYNKWRCLLSSGPSGSTKRTIRNRYDPLLAMEGLKSLVRLAISYRSQTRVLTNGGATAFDKFLLSTTSDAKPAEVYAAFAAFRNKHCFVDGDEISSSATISTATPMSARSLLHTASRRAANNFLSIGNKLRSGVSGGGGGSSATTETSLRTDIAAGVNGKHEHSLVSTGSDGTISNDHTNMNTYWWELPPKSPNELLMNTSPTAQTNKTTTSATLTQSVDALRSLEVWAASRQTAAAKILITAEILHILRPVLYVMALRRWGRRSWKSWSVSLLVELVSIRLNAAGAAGSQAAATAAAEHPAVKGTSLALLYGLQGVRWTREEADELTRRKLLLLYYLARDPFFSRYTRPAIEKWTKALRWIPLAGWIGDKAAEVLFGAQRYYTYTAAS